MREIVLVIILTAVLAGMLAWQYRLPPQQPAGSLDAVEMIAGDPEEFERVTGPVPVNLPADQAAHPEYQHEWWYFTGNLEDGEGRRFGFQFTLFRFALPEQSGTGKSAWESDQVWMAHLAVSDIENERFYTRERFARGALDMAGATEETWWLGPWAVQATDTGWHLVADAGDFELDLQINPLKPHVLQGEAGYSRKGPEPGNASRYLSFTRLDARGMVALDGEQFDVQGMAWLDREWGSSALGPDLAGWDWFSLQFDDERELMFFQLRDNDGRPDRYSAGVKVDFHGNATVLGARDVRLTPLEWWTDEQGVRWPVKWHLVVPEENLELDVRAVFDDQLWRGSFRYWEGAVEASGIQDGLRFEARGYLEMTGYHP